MSDLALRAMLFARHAHRDQVRKYTGNPYADHLAEVAGIVATIHLEFPVDPGVMVAVAWLHDYVEDINPETGIATLSSEFGHEVACGVIALSDLEKGNRAERKAASRTRLSGAPAWVQAIKCADLISNTSSIVQHDPKFAVTYLEEKRLLLAVMTNAHPALHKMAMDATKEPQQ